MSKPKVTYILSKIDKAIAFEWIVNQLEDDFEFSFILIGSKKGHLHHWLKEKNVSVKFIKYSSKKHFLFAWLKCLFALLKNKPKVVHTHLFEANIIGLTTAKVAGIKKRIYTRHHSTFHHQYFPKAVRWDLRTNKLATDIIAISKNVQDVLLNLEHVPVRKTHLIHHGFDLNSFNKVNQGAVLHLKKKYKIPSPSNPVVGCISRYINWKGIQYIIDAFRKFSLTHKNAHLVLANAYGPDQAEIKSYLKEKLHPDQYTEIEFEKDLFSLYHLFDIYVHVPIDSMVEAFGQTYVEALASGVPSVFTLSGIAHEFIKHKENAWVVDYKNSKQIYDGISTLYNDSKTRRTVIENGIESVNPFSLDLFTDKLKKLYEL